MAWAQLVLFVWVYYYYFAFVPFEPVCCSPVAMCVAHSVLCRALAASRALHGGRRELSRMGRQYAEAIGRSHAREALNALVL